MKLDSVKTVCIVVPTFNRRSYLQNLLVQLESQRVDNYKVKVIVVVDGSTDGTLEMLESEFPDVSIVHGTGDWWYTKSMNEGFKRAENLQPDYVLTLNDDIALDRNYLQTLLAATNDLEQDSILGSVAFTQSQPYRIMSSGVKRIKWWRFKNVKYHKQFQPVEPGELHGIHATRVLSGRGMLIPFNVLKSLNYFDEQFVQYASDSDFCYRAEKHGYKCYISWDARIYSFVNETDNCSSFVTSPLSVFVKSFTNKYSRNHLKSTARLLYRHGLKLLFPVTFGIVILATFKAHFINTKLSQ